MYRVHLMALCLILPLAAIGAQRESGARLDLLAADSAWSAAASASPDDGLLSSLADSAYVLLPGQAMVRGREQAAPMVASSATLSHAAISWRAARAVVSRDGTFGATFGYATIARSGGARQPAKYIAAWRRVAGAWRVLAWVLTLAPDGTRAPAPAWPAVVEPAAGPADSTRTPRFAVMLADARFAGFAALHGPGAAFAEFAAEDGALLSGNPGITWGRSAIRESNGSDLRSVLLTWAPVDGFAAASGDLGFTVGQATYVSTAIGRSLHLQYSKYLTIWRRQRNGGWRYVVDGGNGAPAP